MDQAIQILNVMYERYLENYNANGKSDFDAGRVDALKSAIEELQAKNG